MRCLMPKYNNLRRTWKYSNDFKVNAIQLSYVVGVSIKSVAEKLDIHPFMLSRWRKEYRGHVYQKVLKRHAITHSLSRAGKCTDNAHMESFFHSMKMEVIRGNVFDSDKKLRGILGSYINKYYNVSVCIQG
jgi:hypothetical protein